MSSNNVNGPDWPAGGRGASEGADGNWSGRGGEGHARGQQARGDSPRHYPSQQDEYSRQPGRYEGPQGSYGDGQQQRGGYAGPEDTRGRRDDGQRDAGRYGGTGGRHAGGRRQCAGRAEALAARAAGRQRRLGSRWAGRPCSARRSAGQAPDGRQDTGWGGYRGEIRRGVDRMTGGFRAATGQVSGSFRNVGGQLNGSFRNVGGQLSGPLRAVSDRFPRRDGGRGPMNSGPYGAPGPTWPVGPLCQARVDQGGPGGPGYGPAGRGPGDPGGRGPGGPGGPGGRGPGGPGGRGPGRGRVARGPSARATGGGAGRGRRSASSSAPPSACSSLPWSAPTTTCPAPPRSRPRSRRASRTRTPPSTTATARRSHRHVRPTHRQDLTNITQIPLHLQDAVLAAEDRSFWTEGAISPTGILRAAYDDITSSGGNLSGGSTITQEFVRQYYSYNSHRHPADHVSRKIKEIFVAMKLSKQQEQAVDPAELPERDLPGRQLLRRAGRGADLLRRADVSKLTVAQDAVIAAIIQQPANYPLPAVPASPHRPLALRAERHGDDACHPQAQADAMKFPTLLTDSPNFTVARAVRDPRARMTRGHRTS